MSNTMVLASAEEAWRGQYLARVANYTYHLHSTASDLGGLHGRLQQLGLTLHVHVGNPFYDVPSGHHGYVAATEEDIVIAIRGSGEADDWRNNLRMAQQAHWRGGRVHGGFALAARGITLAIQNVLGSKPELYGQKSLWLTGHSSGGSVAILAAEELAAAGIHVAGIYTYGAPKVGDAVYAHSYALRTQIHAFSALGDFVPLLPPAWLVRNGRGLNIQNYVHVVPPKLLVGKTVSMRAALRCLMDKRLSLLERVVGALIEFSPHSLNAYITNLK
ncbi:MAG: lipase family protein [Caldilineaceae bacterium]